MMRLLAGVYHHARGRELRGVSISPEAQSMYDSTVYPVAAVKANQIRGNR